MKILIAFLFLTGSLLVASEKVVICYYGTWATYRPGLGKFDVDNVNAALCSHLNYAFAGIDTEGNIVALDSELDLDKGNFKNFTNLKEKYPHLKTLLAVGGWNEGSAKYSTMAGNETLRQNFIQTALKWLDEYNFDGLDLDWEYPNGRDTVHGEEDVDNFTQLIKELKEAFEKRGLLLTAAVSSTRANAELYYDVAGISKYLDYVNIMTYDMYGSWDPVTGHNAPLHKGEGDTADREDLATVDVAVEYWLSAGCPPEKLVLGMPFYGRTFTLNNTSEHGVRAPATGAGLPGPYTQEAGTIGYNELCSRLKNGTWDVEVDNLAKVPYASQGLQWISFDNPESLTKKIEFANSLNLAGGMVWSIETDDAFNICGGGDFPLLRAINKALGRTVNEVVVVETTPTPTTEISNTTKDN